MIFGSTDNILNQQINIDGSNVRILSERRTPQTGSNGATGFNTRQTYFNITSSSDLRSYIPGFNFLVKGHAENELHQPVDPATVGIPWDSMGALISNLQIRINGAANPIEQYANNRFDTSHFVRMIMEMSRTQIEGMDDVFFAPCFEEDAESTTTFSLECQARSLRWLATSGGGNIEYHSVNWPFPVLCSFAAIPAQWAINQLEVFIDWKSPETVLFKKTADPHTNSYIVDDIQLIVDRTQMSMFQSALELKQDVSAKNTQRVMYRYYDTLETTYTGGATIYQNGITNLEAVVLMFPHTVLSTGVNPLQFCANSLSAISAVYSGISVPQQPIQVDVANKLRNSELYYHYKKCCKKEFTTNFVPALPYTTSYGNALNPADDACYFLYCFCFNNGIAPRLSDSSEVRVITSQTSTSNPAIDSTNCKCYLVKIRNVCFQINNDGTVEKFYS